MGWAFYIARVDLAPSHVAETTYEIPLVITGDGFQFIGKDLKTKQKSISGVVETNYFGRERIWRITLEPIQEQEAAVLREFLASTADGQPFTFDARGTPDMPLAEMTVVRDDEGASEELFIKGLYGERMIQFGFDVREA